MTTNQNDVAYGRNSDGTPGDVLDRLQQILDSTPIYSHVTRPISRTLVRAVARRDQPPARRECPAPGPTQQWRSTPMNEEEEGYSGLFYVMLILGIIGVLGFLMVAAGAGAAGGM